MFASAYLNSDSFRRQLVERLDEEIVGHIRVNDHHLALLTGRLVLSGVALSGADEREIATIGKVRLSVFWPALAWRTLTITSLSIELPELNLIADAHDQTNLSDALALSMPRERTPGTQDDHKWQVAVGDIRLHEGRIAFQHLAKGWSGAIEQIEVSGHGDLKRRSGRMILSAGRMDLQLPGTGHSLHHITIDIDYDEAKENPVTIDMRAGDAHIRAHGRMERVEGEMRWALASEVDLALAQVRPWLPRDFDPAGRVKGKIGLTGVLDDPSAHVDLQISQARVSGFQIDELSLDARLDRRQVNIAGLALHGDWGQIDMTGNIDLRPVFPNSFQEQADGWDALRYGFDLKGRHITPGRIPRIDFPWEGVWQGRVRLEGKGLSMTHASGKGDIDLHAAGVQAAQHGPAADAALSAELAWSDGTLELSQGQADLAGNRLQASGRLQWDSGQLEAAATVQSPRFGELGRFLGITLPGGRGTLQLQGRGTLKQPLLHAALLAHELTLPDWTFGRLLAEADLGADGIVRFKRLVLQNKSSFLEGRGRLDLLAPDGGLQQDPALHLTFDLDPIVSADFSKSLPVEVHLNGRLQVGGSVRHPNADLKLASSRLRWRELVTQATGALRWEDGQLMVAGLHLTRDRSTATLQGRIQWRDANTGQWTADPHVQADLKDARLFLHDWVPEMQGEMTLRAAVRGRFAHLDGTFQAEGSGLDTGVQKFSALRLEGRLAGQTLHVDHLTVSPAAGKPVTGKGWYAFDQRFEVQLRGEDIPLQSIDALRKVPEPTIRGNLDLDVSARGTLQDPDVSGRLHIGRPRIGEEQWDDFNVHLSLQDRQVVVSADLNFDLTARYRMDSGDFDLSAVFARTDLAPYLALLAGNEWGGNLTGHIQASGNRQAMEAVRAQVELSDATLVYRQVDLLHLDRLRAHLADGVVALPPTQVQWMDGGELTIRAEGPVERNIKLEIEGGLPLAALAPFTNRIGDAVGRIRIAAQANGPWARMQWRADVTLSGVGFVPAEWDQAIHDLNGEIRIRPEQVTVDHLSGMLDDGRFSLDGTLQLADWRPVQGRLALNAQSVPLTWPDTMDLLIGAELVLKGDTRQAMLEGQITLLEGAYYKNVKFNLISGITQAKRAEPLSRGWTPPPWFDAIGLNVIIGYRYPLLVDNNVARLEVAPDFKIGGTAAKPVVTGRAQVTEGEVFFRGKTFTVKRGVVDFVNPYKIEPALDIVAETQIRQWQVTLTATGTPDKLAIQMSSDPPESDSNILSLILLGRTSAELSEGGGGNTPKQMLASLVESAWGEDIKKRAGVDILEVETGSQDEKQAEDRIQVTVGKKVSRRLTMKYSVSSGRGETVQRATSEYRLLEHILASGFQDTAGIYGGELLFRIEFR